MRRALTAGACLSALLFAAQARADPGPIVTPARVAASLYGKFFAAPAGADVAAGFDRARPLDRVVTPMDVRASAYGRIFGFEGGAAVAATLKPTVAPRVLVTAQDVAETDTGRGLIRQVALLSIHGGPPPTVAPPPPGCGSWTLDNGCAASTTYVAAPYFQDANFAQDTAESGQLPASPTAPQIAQRNLWLHCVAWSGSTCTTGQNYPFVDYPVGSANPATLRGIYNWNADHPSDACVYHASGATYGGGPNLACIDNANTAGLVEMIAGYDFSNTGNGTGTGCAVLQISGTGTYLGLNYTYALQDDFLQANLESTAGNTNYCWKASTDVGGLAAMIYLKSSAAVGAADVIYENVAIDGNAAGAVAAGIGPADYRVIGTYDNRQGAAVPYDSPIDVYYSIFENLGQLAFLGSNGGTPSIYYSADRDNCISGESYCHGEWLEYTGGNNVRNDTYIGDVYVFDSVYSATTPNVAQTNSAYYPTSGSSNNINQGTLTISGTLTIYNFTGCSNQGGPNYPGTPYGPNNPCNTSGIYGNGVFNIDRLGSVASLIFQNNIMDLTAARYCAGNEDNWGSGASGPTATVAAGGQWVISAPSNAFAAPSANWSGGEENPWLGTYVWAHSGTGGFVPTTVSSFSPSYSYTTGKGTITLANTSEPVISTPINSWGSAASIGSITQGGNYSVSGAYATRLASGPGAVTIPNPFLGDLVCP